MSLKYSGPNDTRRNSRGDVVGVEINSWKGPLSSGNKPCTVPGKWHFEPVTESPWGGD